MTPTVRNQFAFAAFLTFAVSANAAAQECLGLSSDSRGFFSYGVEGTDGATGEGFTLGINLGKASLQLQRRTIEPVSLADDMESLHAQIAYPISKKVPICLTGGLNWTGYDTERVFGWGRDAEGNTTTHGFVGGSFMQLRAPIALSLGKELKLTDKLRVGGFVSNGLVYEFERFTPEAQPRLQQHGLGLAASAGLSLSYSRLMLRSTLWNVKSMRSSYGEYNDFPYASLQLGVKF